MARMHPEIAGLIDWQPLARGGFSTVWQARQQSLDRMVAVKVDHRPLNGDKEQRRFLREAGAAGRLSTHPGIVTVHDAGILADGRPYLVMDLCVGGSLTQWLKPENRQSQRKIRDIGVRIADALAVAHARGVLHRDVKPANILIDAYDQPGLADFGLAAIPEPDQDVSVTLEGMTPAYAAKEVFYRTSPTQFGDVYALAATLYALLDGKPPRWPDTGTPNLPEVIQLHEQPIERLPDVDPAFMDVLLGALADDPESRPTAVQFRDQLSELTFDTSSEVPPPITAPASAPGTSGEVGSRALRSRRRRRSITPILIAASVVLALIIVGLFRWGSSPRAAVPAPAALTVAPTTEKTAGKTVGTTAPPKPSPSDSPSPDASTSTPPNGFVDCSAQLGGTSYCLDPQQPECWTDLYGYADLMLVGTMQDCSRLHVHQTYAVGELAVPVNKQSKLEASPEVQALCTSETLDKVLAEGKSRKDWQISRLAPQVSITSDNFFRCLFTNGERKGPIKLKVPPD